MSNEAIKPDAITTIPPAEQKVELFSSNIISSLNQIINIDGDNNAYEPTCIICSLSNREDIENLWISSKGDFLEVKKIIVSPKNVTKQVLQNHMIFHYESEIKELQKTEYANKIKRISNIELTTLERIKLCIAALTERLIAINSMVPVNNEISMTELEKLKTTETTKLTMSFNNLLKLQASILGEMKDNGELIQIPQRAFIDFFNEQIINAKTEEERNIIKNILNRLAALGKMIA